MTLYVFEEVSVKATHRWKDADGKRRQQTKVFSQTINPYNQNAKGEMKSRAQIYKEINAQRVKWLKERKADGSS